MGWNACKNGDDRWPMAHGLELNSKEAEAFSRGYDAAATQVTETALAAAA